MHIRRHAVAAVFRRSFYGFFGNPTGYVFITIFIAATAYQAFSTESFFAANRADLSALNLVFLWLPVVFIPAITMTAWAQERKLGTDELLLTLPVRDVEVVLGKYLGALGAYTVTLIFALSHGLVLEWLADPDWGLLLASYLGYWIVGAALIPLGLVASCLTANVTVAFILGTALCVAARFAQDLAAMVFGAESRLAGGVGLAEHFKNFTLGVISLPDVLFFALLAGVALYLNVALVGRRHWRKSRQGMPMGAHCALRVAAVVVAAVSVNVLAGRWLDAVRADATAEGLNSISRQTVSLIKSLPGEHPVYIQAYISPEVPDDYVPTRENLLRLLRQMDAVGGSRILVNVRDTELYSDEAIEAEERFNITPQRVMLAEEGSQGSSEVFLGLAFTCGAEQAIIPFLDKGLPVEYELVRSLRVAARADRARVGILGTDVDLMGGFDFQTRTSRPGWAIVDELRKQYDVVQAYPGSPIDPEIDVLIAALPSSMAQEQMDILEDYIASGGAALLLIDPLPIQFPQLSPSRPKVPQQMNPYGYQPPPPEKGDLDALLEQLGISWRNDVVVWDYYNPVPSLRELPPEFVFVGAGAGGRQPFNPNELVSKDMSRVVLMFPGALTALPGKAVRVASLLTSGNISGELRWDQILEAGFMGLNMNQFRPHVPTGREYMLGARVTGPMLRTDEAGEAARPPVEANVIVVADLDFVSNQFFALRREGVKGLEFDNVTFVLNCVDQLAGDSSLIALRNRRPEYRTLKLIEGRRLEFEKKVREQEKQAEQEAEEQLKQAQERLDKKVDEVKERTDIDQRTKDIMLGQVENVENRRLEVTKKAIEAAKQKQIARARMEMWRNIRRIEGIVRRWAVVLPPLPVIFIGLLVFAAQRRREKAGTSPNPPARNDS